MMKMTRTDKKLEKLGFDKLEETRFCVGYSRKRDTHYQTVCILHKQNGPAILQSYDPALFDEKQIGNTCVGLTEQEARLFARKMREYRRKPPKEEV